MLTGLIIVSVICFLVGFFINGFTLYNVALLIPTIMFSVRKVGIHCKLGNILACEILFLFFSIVWRLMFHKFSLLKFILSILVRAVFILVVVYDDTAYVYVSEEKKRL